MLCENCPKRKGIDAIEVMNGSPEYFCDQSPTKTEELACLLRMAIWRLDSLVEDSEDEI